MRKGLSVIKLAELAAKCLAENNIDAVLVGGACVSVYSRNAYQSYDLDFVTESALKDVEKALKSIGFVKKEGRLFVNPETEFMIDMVAPPVSIGKEPVKEFNQIGSLRLLSPTDCVKDRLSAYYHWKDSQSLEQAVMVARAQKNKVDLNKIRIWSVNEGKKDLYAVFAKRIK
jgi:hypothetical protein